MRPSDRPLVSIVIPVFDEADSLPSLFARLRELIDRLGDLSVEVIFVDDHSGDESHTVLREACRQNPEYRLIRLSANRGSLTAIYAGLEQARGDCAVFLAADLQDPPELVPEMLSRWREGCRVVWASRQERKGVSLVERAFARVFYALFNWMADVSLPPYGTDFALIDRVVIDALRRSVHASPFLMGEIAMIGYRQAVVGYVKQARAFGRTKWNLRKKLKLFADAFAHCSYLPLRAMSYTGILLSIVGFAYAMVVILVRLLIGTPIEGWASLMVVVLVLGGVQMIMLGILGEYLWRTLEATRRRPLYFVEEAGGGESDPTRQGADQADRDDVVGET